MERPDLVTLASSENNWQDLPSFERIQLRSVERAFIGLQQSKLFIWTMKCREMTPDSFLRGITTLDVLTAKIEDLFERRLTDRGRQLLGQTVLKVVEPTPKPEDLNGDGFAVIEAVTNWAKRDLGVEMSSIK